MVSRGLHLWVVVFSINAQIVCHVLCLHCLCLGADPLDVDKRASLRRVLKLHVVHQRLHLEVATLAKVTDPVAALHEFARAAHPYFVRVLTLLLRLVALHLFALLLKLLHLAWVVGQMFIQVHFVK